MYIRFSELRGFAVVGREVGASDAPASLGALEDLLVDVRDWRVVHLALAAGGPLATRHVLLGSDRPVAFDLARRELATEWTPYDVDVAPDAASVRTAADDDPDGGAADGGAGTGAGGLLFGPGDPTAPAGGGQAVLGGDPDAVPVPRSEEERHLHGARELLGYAVDGTDGEVGTVTDLLVDRESPAIAWLVVDTGSWLQHREVVLDPAWTRGAAAGSRRAAVALSRGQVRDAPPPADLDGLDRAYGTALAAFYRLVS